MKKIYQTPQVNVVKVETQNFIAESLNVYGNADSKSQLSREAEWDDED